MEPQIGREQGGIRPALAVSSEFFNQLPNDLFVIVPLTTRDRQLRLHVPIRPPEGGLRQSSVAMCDQVEAASVERFLERWGRVEVETLDRIRNVIDLVFRDERSPLQSGDGAQVVE
jgi:mRNA interferase MazF